MEARADQISEPDRCIFRLDRMVLCTRKIDRVQRVRNCAFWDQFPRETMGFAGHCRSMRTVTMGILQEIMTARDARRETRHTIPLAVSKTIPRTSVGMAPAQTYPSRPQTQPIPKPRSNLNSPSEEPLRKRQKPSPFPVHTTTVTISPKFNKMKSAFTPGIPTTTAP